MNEVWRIHHNHLTTPMGESGYTHCACRDCMNEVVSDDMAHPDLCSDCEEAGCEPDSECCVEPELEESEESDDLQEP
jgi:hypothetical protein